jgi:hypothetical protein
VLKKLSLLAAGGIGYVLGAKAGRERYAQIESKFRELAGQPAVQSATEQVKATVKETASSAADSAKEVAGSAAATVSEKASTAKEKVTSDKGASTPAAPMAGAAPSRTAPDVTPA